MSEPHQHEAAHHPPSGSGYQVCRCGATRRVDKGKPSGGWHACELCSHHPNPKPPARRT